jgi:hypothetical protein
MANTLRIKRRTTGLAGAPSGLENAELAFNEVDNTLYYGKGTGGAGGTATTVIPIGGDGAYVALSGDQAIAGTKTFSSTIAGSISGNAATATSLATTRTITVAGDVDGSATFNGTADATINVALDTVNSNVGTFGSTTQVPSITVDGKGRITAISNNSIATSFNLAGNTGTDTILGGETLTITGTNAISTAVTNNTVTISHVDTSTQASVDNSNGTVIQDITLDTYGHITAIGSVNLDNRYYTETEADTRFVDVTGDTLTGFLTLHADPSNAMHAATKQYVDLAVQGLDPKQSVKAATTANIATLSGTLTVDGVSLVAGDRILVKNQTTTSQNGVYVVASGAWTRALDMNEWNEFVSAFLFVEQGTVNGDNGFLCTVDQGGTLGTTAVTFVQFTGASQIIAGAGLTKTGNQLDVVSANSGRIVVNADSIDLATTGISANTYRSVTVDAYGRVTAGTNPTTLAGYGITDAQPLDATLTALAGVTTAADRLIYATGVDAFAVTTLTSFARTLLDDTTNTAARTTLGLGTIATQNANSVAITGGTIDNITFDMGTF